MSPLPKRKPFNKCLISSKFNEKLSFARERLYIVCLKDYALYNSSTNSQILNSAQKIVPIGTVKNDV